MVLTVCGFGETSFSTGGVTTKAYESSSDLIDRFLEFDCFFMHKSATHFLAWFGNP